MHFKCVEYSHIAQKWWKISNLRVKELELVKGTVVKMYFKARIDLQNTVEKKEQIKESF